MSCDAGSKRARASSPRLQQLRRRCATTDAGRVESRPHRHETFELVSGKLDACVSITLAVRRVLGAVSGSSGHRVQREEEFTLSACNTWWALGTCACCCCCCCCLRPSSSRYLWWLVRMHRELLLKLVATLISGLDWWLSPAERHEWRAPTTLISTHSLPTTSTAVQLACAETFLLRLITVAAPALARAGDHCTLPRFFYISLFFIRNTFSDVLQPRRFSNIHKCKMWL